MIVIECFLCYHLTLDEITMLDKIKSWFGKGRIRAEWEGIDRSGKHFAGDAKVPYIGSYDESELMKHIKNELMYQHGIIVTKIKLVAHIED